MNGRVEAAGDQQGAGMWQPYEVVGLFEVSLDFTDLPPQGDGVNANQTVLARRCEKSAIRRETQTGCGVSRIHRICGPVESLGAGVPDFSQPPVSRVADFDCC